MHYAFIKSNLCVNIGVFDNAEAVDKFKNIILKDGLFDDVIELPIGFGIGDTIEMDDSNIVWIKKPSEIEGKEIKLVQNDKGKWEYIHIDVVPEPITEEYLLDYEFRISMLELGLTI